MNIAQWLTTKVNGYDALQPDEVKAIEEFSLVWSYFESRVCQNNANLPVISAAVEALRTSAHGIQPAPFAAHLQYFSNRYFPNKSVSYHFPHLRFQKKADENFVADVLMGTLNSSNEQIAALLFITYRLRNNLFHGEKWAYGIAGQRDNFLHAACVLAAFIDQYDAAGL